MGKGSPTPDDQLLPLELVQLYTCDKYVCTLSPNLQQVAKKELGETEINRVQSLEQMREWIRKTNYIKDCRLDSNFLLRFLRQKKFNVPMAQETLTRYISMRQEYPGWFHDTSMHDPAVMDLIDRGVAFALPKRGKDGRRILFTVGGNIDPNVHTTEQVMKALMVVFESFLEDEENQILGFHYILDESGITGSHIMKLWNPTDMLKIWGTTEKGMPMRHKRMDFVQLPSILGHVFTFAKGLMSKKLQSRIVLYKNAQALTKAIETKLLPKEYGGEVPMTEMIEMFKDEIRDRQSRLLALDRMHIDMELMKKASCIGSENCGASVANKLVMSGVSGSFKRLEID